MSKLETLKVSKFLTYRQNQYLLNTTWQPRVEFFMSVWGLQDNQSKLILTANYLLQALSLFGLGLEPFTIGQRAYPT